MQLESETHCDPGLCKNGMLNLYNHHFINPLKVIDLDTDYQLEF